ncbi:MAG: DUF1501 domain-containing protein [Myxococcota bacterium]
MKRRSFFSMMAAAGLCGTSWSPGAEAGLAGGAGPMQGPYTGPFFVTFAADGGWDPTGFCDPHANLHNGYNNDGIASAGAIKYADIGNNAAFFQRFADQLLIINGLDTSTNNHSVGRRHVWTGRQDMTHPHWAALAAGTHGPEQPLAYIGEASQSATEGVVARTRVSNSDVLTELSFPDKVNAANPEDLQTYHSEPAHEMIDAWRTSRLERMQQEQNLPRIDAALANLITARSGSNELALLQSYLPETLATNEVRRQIQIALASYKAGIAVSATFGMNGFDTHENNDAAQDSVRATLLGHVEFLWDEAERQGIGEQIVCAIGSDFARTPEYNGINGKNHWPVTSMMLMGQGIEGNRVVGGTDSGQRALKVDPNTLALSNSGVTLTPAHVHAALRELAGVDPSFDALFPLGISDPISGLLGTA